MTWICWTDFRDFWVIFFILTQLSKKTPPPRCIPRLFIIWLPTSATWTSKLVKLLAMNKLNHHLEQIFEHLEFFFVSKRLQRSISQFQIYSSASTLLLPPTVFTLFRLIYSIRILHTKTKNASFYTYISPSSHHLRKHHDSWNFRLKHEFFAEKRKNRIQKSQKLQFFNGPNQQQP